jgi:Polysaccharide biosynthesis C-terminal domain
MIVIYPLVMRFGMLGGQIACLLSVFTGYVIQIVQIQRLTGFRWTSHSRSVIVAVVASVVVSVGLLAERHTILMTAPHSNMVLGFIASGIVLSLSAFVFAREIGQHNENFAMQ